MAGNIPKYQYRRLKEGEFRLAELLPAVIKSSALQVKFITASLDVPVQYEVLCYTWDQPDPLHTITCDGSPLLSIKSVTEALYALRGQYRSRLLWIAAICINQEDINERSTQIRSMNRISRQAFRAIFWLGVETSLTGSAFELLSSIVLARRQVFQDLNLYPPKQISAGHILGEYRKRLPSPAVVGWKGLDEFLNRRLFTRAWTLPDLVLQNAVLRCGSLEFPWDDFCYGLEGYASYSYPNIIRSPGMQVVINAAGLRRRCFEGNTLPLGFDNLLDAMRNLNATNKRDKVFAAYDTLNTFVPGTANTLEVDYAIASEHIYMEVAKILNSDLKFAPYFCSLAMTDDRESRRLEGRKLPSWAPEWTNQEPVYRLNSMENLFFASRRRSPEGLSTSDQGGFSFKGCIVDSVSQFANYLPPRRLYDKYNVSGANSFFFSEWFEWAGENGRHQYQKDNERLLLHWVETIQAKGCDLWQSFEPHDSTLLLAQARAWLRYLEDEDQEETEEIRQFHAACLPSHGRRFGISTRGHFCLLPRSASAYDLICIPLGSKVPFIFRKGDQDYQNIGECYLHGAMSGEALEWDGAKEVNFSLR